MDLLLTLGEMIGLGGFFYYLVRGLQQKIIGLEGVISAQQDTLKVMDKRIEETEKVGNIYRDLLSSLPSDLDNFKTILSKTKDETIVELQNQNETIKKKLTMAEKTIEQSGLGKEVINSHLKVLHNLLDSQRDPHGHDKKSELVTLCEFNDRRIEESVATLVRSHTFEDFINAIGMKLHVTEDDSIIKKVMSDRVTPDGDKMEVFTAGHSIYAGWYCAVNDSLYVNAERLSFYKDEFSAVKTIV